MGWTIGDVCCQAFATLFGDFVAPQKHGYFRGPEMEVNIYSIF
jgi:hypothetical protein